MTIRKVLSYIKLKSDFTFSSVWFLFVQGCSRDSVTLGFPQSRVVGPDPGIQEWDSEEGEPQKEGTMGAGFHWDFWEALRIPPRVVSPRDRSLHCLPNLRLTTGSWLRLNHRGTWTPQATGESEGHRCAWGGMMPLVQWWLGSDMSQRDVTWVIRCLPRDGRFKTDICTKEGSSLILS